MASRHNSEDELSVQKISSQAFALLGVSHFFFGGICGGDHLEKGGTMAWNERTKALHFASGAAERDYKYEKYNNQPVIWHVTAISLGTWEREGRGEFI